MKKYLGKLVLSALVLTSPIWGYNCNKANNELSDVVKTEKTVQDETDKDFGPEVIYQHMTERAISDNQNYIIMNDHIKEGNSDKVYELLEKYISRSLLIMKNMYKIINDRNVSAEFKETLEKQIKVAEDYLKNK